MKRRRNSSIEGRVFNLLKDSKGRKSKVKTLSLPVYHAWQPPSPPLLLLFLLPLLLPPQEIAISANLERNFTEILAGDIERALINDSMSLVIGHVPSLSRALGLSALVKAGILMKHIHLEPRLVPRRTFPRLEQQDKVEITSNLSRVIVS